MFLENALYLTLSQHMDTYIHMYELHSLHAWAHRPSIQTHNYVYETAKAEFDR